MVFLSNYLVFKIVLAALGRVDYPVAGDLELKYDTANKIYLSGGSLDYVDDATLYTTIAGETTSYDIQFNSLNLDASNEQILFANDAEAGDELGNSCDVYGEYAVVGAPKEDTNGVSNAGSVYVYHRSGNTWTQQAKLTASDGEASDLLGQTKESLAIYGDTVVVGALSEDTGGSAAGSAYVFVRSGTTWSQQAILRASNAGASDQFGMGLAIYKDTIVIGAPTEDTTASDAGSLYVFTRSGTTWTQRAQLQASNAGASDRLGDSVSIDGDTIIAGAYPEDTTASDAGSAYIFTGSGATWTQQAQIQASDAAATDYFGYSVSISGNTVVVGARYDDDGGSNSGSAYVFVRSGTTWTQQAKLTASDAQADDDFGWDVDIDKDHIVVTAPREDTNANDAGAVYVFSRSGSTWTEIKKIRASITVGSINYLGYGGAAIHDGTIITAAPNESTKATYAGAAYIYGSQKVTNYYITDAGKYSVDATIAGLNYKTNEVEVTGSIQAVTKYTDNETDFTASKAVLSSTSSISYHQGGMSDNGEYYYYGQQVYKKDTGSFTYTTYGSALSSTIFSGSHSSISHDGNYIVSYYTNSTQQLHIIKNNGSTFTSHQIIASPNSSARNDTQATFVPGPLKHFVWVERVSNTTNVTFHFYKYNSSTDNWALDFSVTNPTGLTTSSTGYWGRGGISFSRDGNYLAVSYNTNPGAAVFKVDWTNQTLTLKYQNSQTGFFACFLSSDAKYFYYSTGSGTTAGKMLYSANGDWEGTPTDVTSSFTNVGNLGDHSSIFSDRYIFSEKGGSARYIFKWNDLIRPTLKFDNYNKLSMTNTPTNTSSKLFLGSNVYDIGTLTSDLTIETPGLYRGLVFDTSSNVAYFNKTTVGAIASTQAGYGADTIIYGTVQSGASHGTSQGGFGNNTILNADGTRLLVTDPINYPSGHGRAYIYHLENGSWDLKQTWDNPDNSGQRFSDGVCMNEDGTRLFLMQPSSNKVYTYEYASGAWPTANAGTHTISPGSTMNHEASTLACNKAGDVLVIGYGNSNKVKIYRRTSATSWSIDSGGDLTYNRGVAINGDGTRAFMAYSDGKVYMVEWNGSTWSSATEIISSGYTNWWATTMMSDSAGETLVMRSGGSTSLESGIYERASNGTWSRAQGIEGKVSIYGSSMPCISYDGTMVLTGNFRYDSNKGLAQLWQKSGGSWSLTKEYLNPDASPSNGDYWGTGCGIARTTKHKIAIGMQGDDTAGTDYGSVHIYTNAIPDFISFDTYNKLSLSGITNPTSKLHALPTGAESTTTYDIGSATNIYIESEGTYTAEIKGATNFALSSNIVGAIEGNPLRQVATGGNVSLALTQDGFVYAWGEDTYGQMGQGTTDTNVNTPVKVKGVGGSGFLSNITKITVGGTFCIALASDGTLYTWGQNNHNQLGDGTTTERKTPVTVSYSGDPISNISAGMYHSAFTTTTGKVYAFGRNNQGQIGDNTSGTNRSTPTQVVGVGNVGTLEGIRDVSCGDDFTHAIKDSDGSVYGWGKQLYGMIGNGQNSGDALTPTSVILASDSSAVTGITQISGGGDSSLMLKSDGTVYACGYNGLGQIGNGTITDADSGLVQVLGVGGSGYLTGITQIAIAYASSLALKSDGTMYSWGNNYDGQNGLGTVGGTNPTTPVAITLLTDVDTINTGGKPSHFIVTKLDGSVFCWGRGDEGQIGDGTNTADQGTPTQVLAGAGPSVDGKFNLFTDPKLNFDTYNKLTFTGADTGSTYKLKYGSNTYDLGTISNVYIANPGTYSAEIKGATNFALSSNVVSGTISGSPIRQVSAGGIHSLALTQDGFVYAWGKGQFGRLGQGSGDVADKNTPVKVKGVGGIGYLSNITKIAAGGYHNIVLASDGKMYTWGYNGYGNLGDGTQTQRETPVEVSHSGDAVSNISCGFAHTAFTTTTGKVYCFGHGPNGQIGNNTTSTNTLNPTQVVGVGNSGTLAGIRDVTCGDSFTHAIKDSDGSVYAWGKNTYGMLGDGTTTQRTTPVPVILAGGSAVTGITQISGGGDYALMLKSDGTVYACGYGSNGQLGDGSISNNDTGLVQVQGVGGSGNLTSITQIAAAESTSLALKNDGTMYSWGGNIDGQNGLGTVGGTNPTTPVAITLLTGVDSINAGGKPYHFIASKPDGSVFCWGQGDSGQLGDGTNTADQGTPTQVLAGAGPSIGGKFNLFTDPKLDFDTYNKLTLSDLESGSTSNVLFNGNTYSIGTASNVYISEQGTYDVESKGTTTFALTSNVVGVLGSAPISFTIFPSSISLGGHWQNNYGPATYTKTSHTTTQIVYDLTGSAILSALGGSTTAHGIKFNATSSGIELDVENADDDNTPHTFTSTTITTATSSGIVTVGQSISLKAANGNEEATFTVPDFGYKSGNPTFLTHDGYKLVVKNINPTSTTLKYGSNTYEIGSATNIYVKDTGAYTAEIGSAADFAFTSNTVSGTIKTIEPVITGGYQFGHALKYDGKLYGWGENSNGELGVNDTTDKTVPTLCTGIPQGEIVSIWKQSIRGQSRWAKTRDGRIWVTGDHDSYCLPGSSSDFTTFTDVSAEFGDYTQTSNNVVWASGSERATQVLMENGDVWSFGNDVGSLGVLGQGASPTSDRTPRKLSGISNVTKIVYNGDLVLALDSSNVVWMWGRNEVGNGSTLGWGPYNVPTNIMSTGTNSLTSLLATDSETVIDIESSYYSMFALTDKGTVYAAGHNASGQLGQGDTTAKTSSDGWVKIEYFTSNAITVNKLYVGGGNPHVFADTSDGWYCWGENNTGELGLGDTADKLSPVKFTGVSNIKKFGVGYLVSYAITEDGKYYAWGNGTTYARGDNTTGNISYPKYIDTLPNILAPSFEFDGYDKVFVGGTFVYEFYLNADSSAVPIITEISSTDVTLSASNLTLESGWVISNGATDTKTHLFDGDLTNTKETAFTASRSVGQKLLTLTTNTELTNLSISSQAPQYVPGWKIICNGTTVLTEFESGGTGTSPNPYTKSYSFSSITSLTKYTKGTTTYDAGKASIITVPDPGTYDAQLKKSGAFTLKSATVPATKASGLYTWAFHHGNFDNAYGDGDILTARDNGRFYADTPAYTSASIGTITPASAATPTQPTLVDNIAPGSHQGLAEYPSAVYYRTSTTSTSYVYKLTGSADIYDIAYDWTTKEWKDTDTHSVHSFFNDTNSATTNKQIYNPVTVYIFKSTTLWAQFTNPYYEDTVSSTTYTFEPPSGGLTANVLMVAGGGGGGRVQYAGGGGAGGLVYTAGTSLAQGATKTIVVGNGGLIGGDSGNDTTFTNLTTAVKGGYGGDSAGIEPQDGGSGGGQAYSSSTTSSGTSGQGYGGGGKSPATADESGGGGGGAGEAGHDGSIVGSSLGDGRGGNGGKGKFFGTGSSDTNFGDEYGEDGWFAGGGGGGTIRNSWSGLPGKGGGGRGYGVLEYKTNDDLEGVKGFHHTGGGGGGGGWSGKDGGGGGSGIVLIQTNVPTPRVNTNVVISNDYYVHAMIEDSQTHTSYRRGAGGNGHNSGGYHDNIRKADGSLGRVYRATGYGYINISGADSLVSTVEGIFYPIEQERYDGILEIGHNSSHDVELEMASDGTAKLYRNQGGTHLASGTVKCFTVGKWHHVVLTLDANRNAVAYVNGYPVVSTTYSSAILPGSRAQNCIYRTGVGATFRKFMFYYFKTYNSVLNQNQTLKLASSVGLGPKLEYDGLNTIKILNTEPGSSVKLFTSNVADTSNVFIVADPAAGEYTVPESGKYYAEIKGTDTFTITKTLDVSGTFPLYQYPPVATGTKSSLTTSLSADTWNTWTMSGASTGNGQYQAKTSHATVAPGGTHAAAAGVFTNGVKIEIISDGGASIYSFLQTNQLTNFDITLQLPSAKIIRKYVLYPADTNAPVSTPGGSVDPILPGNGGEENTRRAKSWVLKGSNDSTSWTTIDTVTNKPPSIYGDVHTVSSPASYQYYQISISANNGSSQSLSLGEWQLWGDA